MTGPGGHSGMAARPAERFCRRFAAATGAAALLLGATVLVGGWLSGIEILASLPPAWPTMKANTALCFLLSGAALYLSAPGTARFPWSDRLGLIAAGLVAAIGGLSLAEYGFGIGLGIDQLLFSDAASQLAGSATPGRMSVMTAFDFTLTGAALLTLPGRSRGAPLFAQFCGLAVIFTAYIAVLVYLFEAEAIRSAHIFSTMAIHTAGGFLLLGAGLLAARPDAGIMRLVVSQHTGGLAARRLLPIVFLLPIVLGYLCLQGERAGYYETAFGAVLLVAASTVLFALFILWNVKAFDKAECDHRQLDLVRTLNAELKAQAEFSRAILDSANDAFVAINQAGAITDWNPQAERMFGWSADDAIRRNVADLLIPARFREAHYGGLHLFLETGKSAIMHRPIELVALHRDGREIPIELSVWPQRTAGGWTFNAFARDITERKRHGEALRESEERFRLLVENAAEYAIFMLDPVGKVATWNSGAERVKGYAAGDIVGKDVAVFYTDQDRKAGLPRRILETAQRDGSFHDEGWRVRKDGTRFWANVTVTAIRCPDGNLLGFGKVTRDLTERRAAEAAVADLNRQLQARVAELNCVNNDLEAFAYSVAHDLRAPIRAIVGFTRIIAEEQAGALPGETKELLNRVLRAGETMGQLIDDLLVFSRLGRQSMTMEEVRLSDLARQAVADHQDECEARGIEIAIADLGAATGDATLLRQVFVNLIGNAVKYTRGAAKPKIEVGRRDGQGPDGETVYYVKDNGAGFDMEFSAKLFEIFQRLHSADEFEGTGVGLAIVERAVVRHGGRVWAEGKVGEGATFYFTLGTERAERAA